MCSGPLFSPALVPSPQHPMRGCRVSAGAGGLFPARARHPPRLCGLSPSLAARCWWNSCFDLQNADCQNILHSRRLGVTSRDAELRGVEIPAPEPAPGVAGVTFAPVLPVPGLQQPPERLRLRHARPWPDIGTSEVAVSQLTDPGRLMKHSQKEGTMGKTPRHNGGVRNCNSPPDFL